MMKTLPLRVALALGCLAATPAVAVTHILNLNGVVSSGSTATVVSGPTQFDFFIISLSGLTPLTLAVGDEVQATVTLDTPLTMPSAPLGNFVRLFLQDGSFSGTSTSTSGTLELFNGGSSVGSGGSGASTSSSVVSSFFNFGGSSLTYDSVQTTFTIDSLSAPTLDVNLATLDYVLLSPAPTAAVPEPATWGTMLFGFALIGSTLRRRDRKLVLA